MQMNGPQHELFELEPTLRAERTRLVGLCAYLTGNADVAEDLAHDTLIEAWRHQSALRNPAMYQAWLTGIARNVCLRWQQQHVREQQRRVPPPYTLNLSDLLHDIAADVDLDVELERDELATLLDRALALLPADTRAVLIQKYVEDSPHAEIAARLRLSENAVAVRLHRGKLAFKRILATQLRDDAAAHGLITLPDTWQETRIWCPNCGQRRLVGHLHREQRGLFQLWCPDWCTGPGVAIANTYFPALLNNVKTYKPALSRGMTWLDRYYRANGTMNRRVVCRVCGREASVELCLPSYALAQRDTRGVHVRCDHCRAQSPMHECLTGLVRCCGEVQQFWQQHARIRTCPEQEVEADGMAALVVRFESVATAAHLDVVIARDTFQLLQVHGAPPRRQQGSR
jgi:RNA polymerase sigma-70 factor (ECF subfamily)